MQWTRSSQIVRMGAAMRGRMNSIMGLTPPPRAYPLAAHVRGLAGHVAYAAAYRAAARLVH